MYLFQQQAQNLITIITNLVPTIVMLKTVRLLHVR